MPKPPKPQFTWKRLKRKRCKRCNVKLTAKNCYLYTNKRDGRTYAHSYCRKCNRLKFLEWKAKHPKLYRQVQRRADLKSHYHTTPEWFEQKLNEQGRRCGICGTEKFGPKGPCLDHDHVTGANRGIVCSPCNGALAAIESVENWPEKALEYLARYR